MKDKHTYCKKWPGMVVQRSFVKGHSFPNGLYVQYFWPITCFGVVKRDQQTSTSKCSVTNLDEKDNLTLFGLRTRPPLSPVTPITVDNLFQSFLFWTEYYSVNSVCVLRCGQSWRKCKLLMITITENIYLFPAVDNGKVYLLVIKFENVKHQHGMICLTL